MDDLSQQAAAILLQEPGDHDSTGPGADATLRVTRQLADALVRTSELLEPVAEAAQQWLDAKDDGDRDALADARADLTPALTPPSDLLGLLQRLPRLARPPLTPTAP